MATKGLVAIGSVFATMLHGSVGAGSTLPAFDKKQVNGHSTETWENLQTSKSMIPCKRDINFVQRTHLSET